MKVLELPDHDKFHLAYKMCKSKVARAIIDCLSQNGELNVTMIYIKTRIQQTIISFYIRRLECIGIVKAQTIGKCRYYKLTNVGLPDRLKELALVI
ncbi:MAG: helix-turn-helix domain-containing protein [Saprospiraceae bacterium]|nr:helix-turn-helix transcriptional regulator [Saprospiraceae bacterium]